MENMLLVGLSRQMTLERQLDVVANNVANINTTGFKADRSLFEEYLRSPAHEDNFVPSDRRVSFVHDRATFHDFAPGPSEQTKNPLDIAIDGADQVAPDGWIVKGGGGAHTREKIVAASSDRFVVIASADKLVETIAAPIPLELLPYGLDATLARLGEVAVRGGPPSPDGGVIADYLGPVEDPAAVAAWLDATPGVVDHGLFPPALTSEVLVGRGAEVERLAV